jgi:chemotaxis protein CheZ
MSFDHKRYRIEQTLRKHRVLDDGAHAEAGNGAAGARGDHRITEILIAISELTRLLEPAQRLANDVIDSYRSDITEIYKLRDELDAMKAAIIATKREVAALQRRDSEGHGMRRAAGELDAVVETTERATTAILNAVEEIEANANLLRASGGRIGGNDCIGAILDRVVVLYEACNFQDLTGQRLQKIVGVLKFVEERLDRMIQVWGGLEAFKELVEQDSAALSGDDHKTLLNGPKLHDEGHVSQNDIDALFN